MSWEVVFKFIAKNPPSILILGGILGWILCGVTHDPIFCDNWQSFVIVGVALQILWMAFKFKLIPH